MRRRGTWRAGIVVAFLSVPAAAMAQLDEALISQHIVTVRVFKGDEVVAEGVGVVINDQGDVLTSAAVADAGARAHVIAPDSRELVAERKWQGRAWDLAVLRAAGLSAPGLPVSEAEVARGAAVYTVTPGAGSGTAAFAKGAFGELATVSLSGRDVRFVQHNAELDVRGYGSPLVNECGDVVGLNVPDPKRMSILGFPHKIVPRDVFYALGASEIVTRLEAEGVEFATVTDVCKSAAERAKEEKEEAEQKTAEAEQKTAEAEQKTAEAEQKAAEAEQEAAEAAKAKEAARVEAERARREAAAAKAEREEAERLATEAREREEAERRQSETMKHYVKWGAVLAAAVLLLLLLFWVLSAHRKRRALHTAQSRAVYAEQDAAQARRRVAEIPEPAPFDCVLTGADGDGAPYAMNVGRDALGAPAGVVVGRDPGRASHVVADPSVSRAHARMYVKDGELHVEDVGSTNGTYLNGERLEVGAGARVRDGDELMVGSLTLRVELRR